MKILKMLTLLLLFCSCLNSKCDTLNEFEESEITKALYKKQIPKEILEILLATNEINPSVLNSKHKYYFGFKKRLNDDHFLISYKDTYVPQYRFTHKLMNWNDEFYCIFNIKQNRVVSKLKVSSDDPVSSYLKKQGNYYVVNSRFSRFIPKESDCKDIIRENDSSITKYEIKNNRFVEVTNNQ